MQRAPQLPQFAGSVVRFEQRLKPKSLQSTFGGLQAQLPFTQSWPLGQLLPQLPQLLGSVWRFAQLPPQLCDGGWQVLPQAPLLQT